MNASFSGVPGLLRLLFESSWHATLLVPLVLAVRFLFRRHLAPAWKHALWWIVLGRLLVLEPPASPWSVFNLLPRSDASKAVEPDAFLDLADDAWQPVLPVADTTEIAPSSRNVPSDSLPVERPVLGDTGVLRRSLPIGVSAPPVAVLAWLWAAGALAFLGRLIVQNVRFATRVRNGMQPADSRLEARLDTCRARMGVRRSIELRVGDAVASPAVYGAFHPRLLLPRRLAESCSPENLDLVFLHELAHVRRGDLLVHGLIRVLQALHWFNPVLAWVFRRIRTDRELAADALALQIAGPERCRAYGMTILELLSNWSRDPVQAGTVGILEDSTSLEHRIRAIATFRPASRRASFAGILVAGLALASWTGARVPRTEPPTATATAGDSSVTTLPPETATNDITTANATATTRVRVPGDIPVIGPLLSKHSPDSAPPDTITSIRRLLARGSEALQNDSPAEAAKAFEDACSEIDALAAGSRTGAGAESERHAAIEGVRTSRLRLARMAFRRDYLHEANAHLDRIAKIVPEDSEARDLRRTVLQRFDARIRGISPGPSGPTHPPAAASADSLTEEAAGWLGAGGWDKAQEAIDRALAFAPAHQRAHLIRGQILEARASLGSRGAAKSASKGRERIHALLESIRVPEVRLDRVPLQEAVRHLVEVSRTGDPAGSGINFFLNPYLDNTTSNPAIDPDTGAAVSNISSEPAPLGNILVRIDPPLRDVRLADVLRAVILSAESPIHFVVEDYAVVLAHGSPRPALVTRVFRVNPDRIKRSLGEITGLQTINPPPSPWPSGLEATGGGFTNSVPGTDPATQESVRSFFQAAGVSLAPPNAMFFNDRLGLLMIRATTEEIETIEAAVEVLNAEPAEFIARVQGPDGGGLARRTSTHAPDGDTEPAGRTPVEPQTQPSQRVAPEPDRPVRETSPGSASDQSLIERYQEYRDALTRLDGLLTRYTDKWPEVIEARKRVETLRYGLSESSIVQPLPPARPLEEIPESLVLLQGERSFFRGEVISNANRAEHLRLWASTNRTPDPILFVYAEPKIPMSNVLSALDDTRAAGIRRVSFSDKPVPRDDGTSDLAPWRSAAEVPKPKDAGRSRILIAFEADWSTQSALNRQVLGTSRLQRFFASRGVELFRVDCTREAEAVRDLKQLYAVSAIPSYALHDPKAGGWTVISGILTEGAITDAFGSERVR